jgi:hypothetical protein
MCDVLLQGIMQGTEYLIFHHGHLISLLNKVLGLNSRELTGMKSLAMLTNSEDIRCPTKVILFSYPVRT